MFEMPIVLPRAAFSPREVARAADLWGAFQDLAVAGSSDAGYPPERYVEERISFIVRSMVVVHRRETRFGEPLRGTTWPSRFRRGMFFRREARLVAPDGPIASATQEWVHVSSDVQLARASQSVVAAFPPEVHDPSVQMPAWQPVEGGVLHRYELECRHTWMDPLAHVNHPRYLDWAEEGIARVMVSGHLDPVSIRPVAESAVYRAGVVAPQRVEVTTRVIGHIEETAVVCAHKMSVGEREVASVTTVRSMVGARRGALLSALCARGSS